MKFTPEQLEETFEKMQSEEKAIRIDRGRKYCGKEDSLENISRFGSDGAIVHLSECFNRIVNMYGKPKDMKVLRNAVYDLRNYAGFIPILEERQETPQVPPTSTPQVKSWEEMRKETVKSEVDKLGEMLK